MNEIVSLPLSASNKGQGVLITSQSSPGTLIHTSNSNNTDKDFIWLWVSATTYRSYLTEPILITVIKKYNDLLVNDGTYALENGRKLLVESGMLLTGGVQLYIFNSSASVSNLDYDLVANGYVHRRTEI